MKQTSTLFGAGIPSGGGSVSAAIRVRPLTPTMGAEVEGVDASAPLDAVTRQALRQAWARYGLLLLRDQQLDEAQQTAFALIFGQSSDEGEYGAQHYVSNVQPNGLVPYGELAFHVDHSWSATPLRGLMLYAIEVPPAGAGGDTLFADVQRAWDALPPERREQIRELEIVHSYPDQSRHVPIPGPDPRPGMPTATHPLAYQHPVTGDLLLFCSARHFDRIVGWPADESLALATELSARIGESLAYVHPWRKGDLLVIDNLRLQHARSDFDPLHRRHLRRTQIGEPHVG